jgi:lipid-binding SYLF domain-containing protein
MKIGWISITTVAFSLLLILVGNPAAGQQQATHEKLTTEAERAMDAANVLKEMMDVPESAIPEELMARAHGIAVIPHVVKGAFGLGGQWGKGLISQRNEDGTWSTPAYIQIGGGSLGFQIGLQATDVVLVFTDASGIKGLLRGKVKLGADVSATAGPVGRKAEVGTDILLRSGIFAYSRSKGLFAGVSLDGSVVSIDNDANRKVYGKKLTGEQILLENQVQTNPTVENFVSTLQKISPAHVHETKKS